MEENLGNSGANGNAPDPDKIREMYPIEGDGDALEPFMDETEHREINQDDPKEIAHWAFEFQISESELREAIVLNGNSLREVKKFLSI